MHVKFFGRHLALPFVPKSASRAPAAPVASRELLENARLPTDELFRLLDTSLDGLLDREADERLKLHGENAVAVDQHRNPLLELLALFAKPLPMLLMGLAGLNWYIGETKGAVVVALMVVLSTLLSFVQEFRSNRAAERLRDMVSTTASVLRKDISVAVPEEVNRAFHVHIHLRPAHMEEIPITQVVPGDIVRLSAGDMVPADVRVLSAKDLFINQSTLTGEAMPVEKFAGPADPAIASALELHNLCFMGSNVVSGTALAVVLATGRKTYFGSIAASVLGQRQQTSFDRGINRFIWLMIRFMLVMVPMVFLINGFSKGDWMEAFMFAVAVAVGLTPELLPMIVTINLAKGAISMSRKKVIVKRLNSIQNFGAMDVLCTDKTGTLTQDRVILEKHVNIAGEESEHVLEYAYLNSYYQSGLKNLLDVAVLEHAEVDEKLHVARRFSKVDEIPFDFQRRRMSVVVEENRGKHILVCKGAVEEVFAVCSHTELAGEILPLERQHQGSLREIVRELNEDGFRVIAVAYKEIPEGQSTYSVLDESALILTGYIAFLDPPKESAAGAIAQLQGYGVSVKILTGDNEVVTRKVCSQVGLSVARVVLGSEIETLSDLELAEVAEGVSVFAKLSPEQKARIIRALHLKGHVVGFMGDGINDGPALKAADVGVSVDTAVDIAKESADIILLEKSLLVLGEGVLEGRRVFGNIIKYIKMGASSNFGNMFSVLGASAFLPFLPMAPVQILFNNLLYDVSQTAVATDHVDEEYLLRPRAWDIANIARYMAYIGPISSIFDYATFAAMWYLFDCTTPDKAGLFQTGWFIESLLSQTLIVHVIRTGKIPFFQSWASLPLLVTSLAICAVGMMLPYSGFAHALDMTPPPMGYWAVLAAILLAYMALTQVVKSWVIKRFGLA
ncbi:MAG: magnesium-translocating P-type ATPase [Rhodocyclaceae bacterium]|nr:magnesium-translocating P-type ATPase [Rhodocyclaceae bacterium]